MRCKLKPKVEGITKCKDLLWFFFLLGMMGEKQRKLRAF
jgi:hypothetical protein